MTPRATAAVAEVADGASNAIVIRHPAWIGVTVARADMVSGGKMEMQLASALLTQQWWGASLENQRRR